MILVAVDTSGQRAAATGPGIKHRWIRERA
jgi:hypothetical protein